MIFLTPTHNLVFKLSTAKTVVDKSPHIKQTKFLCIGFEHIEYKFVLVNKLLIC